MAAAMLLLLPTASHGLPPVTRYPQVPLIKVARGSWTRPRANIFGKVTLVAREDDGDWHFRVVDEDDNFVVCEIIPEFQMPNGHPRVGSSVRVWGVVRWDGQHRWGEIHPVVGWSLQER